MSTAEELQAASGAPFVHELRIRYAECDPQGIVFNAHYLAYFDISLTELWRAAFGSYAVMVDRGVDLVVAETRLRYRQPARFDEVLSVAVAVTRLGTSAVVTEHSVRRGEEMIAEGEMRHVMVDASTLVKAAIPDWVREGLAPWTLPETKPPVTGSSAVGSSAVPAASASSTSYPAAPAAPGPA